MMKVSTLIGTDKADENAMDGMSKRLSETQQNVERLKLFIAAAREREAELSAEREKILPAARLRNHAQAQQRVGTIDAELARVRVGLADDETVLSAQIAQSEAIEHDIVRIEWEGRRAKVRELLTARLNSKIASKLKDLAEEMAATIQAAKEEDEKAMAAIANFSEKIGECTIRDLAVIRSKALSAKLNEVLVIDRRQLGAYGYAGIDLEAHDRETFENVLQTLDNLELVF